METQSRVIIQFQCYLKKVFKIKNYTLFQLIWAKYTLSTARTSYKLKTRLGERVRHYFAARLRKRSVFRKPLARKKEPVRRFYARPNVMHEKLVVDASGIPRRDTRNLSPLRPRSALRSTVSIEAERRREGFESNTRARFNWSTNKASPRPTRLLTNTGLTRSFLRSTSRPLLFLAARENAN